MLIGAPPPNRFFFFMARLSFVSISISKRTNKNRLKNVRCRNEKHTNERTRELEIKRFPSRPGVGDARLCRRRDNLVRPLPVFFLHSSPSNNNNNPVLSVNDLTNTKLATCFVCFFFFSFFFFGFCCCFGGD